MALWTALKGLVGVRPPDMLNSSRLILSVLRRSQITLQALRPFS